MTRWTFVIVLAAVLAVGQTGYASAFQNEPPGFRGIPWGAHIDDIQAEMGLVRAKFKSSRGLAVETRSPDEEGFFFPAADSYLAGYYRPDERLTLGRAEVESILYSFYKDRLFRVFIRYREEWNYEALKDEFFNIHGPGRERSDDYRTWWWKGQDVSLGLSYGLFSRDGTVSYVYKPIEEQRKQDILDEAKAGGPGF